MRTPLCDRCSADQRIEALLDDAAVVRCLRCDQLSYLPRRSLLGRIRHALVTGVERLAPPSAATGAGSWIPGA